MYLEKIIETIFKNKTEEESEGLLNFLSDKMWSMYKDYLMDKLLIVKNEIDSWTFLFDNAKEEKEYRFAVELPTSKFSNDFAIKLKSVTGLSQETHGLTIQMAEDGSNFVVEGKPSLEYFRGQGNPVESTYELVLQFEIISKESSNITSLVEKKVPFVINQDPKKLWRNLPVDWEKMPEPKYQNEDIQVEYVKVEALEDGTPQKDIVVASKRGRSHAHEAKPRDDFFKVKHLDNGWYIMAVADGAGSAKNSREGSRIACTESVDYCQKQLIDNKDFETAINMYNEYQNESENDARKQVGDYIYRIVCNAALTAHKSIEKEATAQNIPSKTYSTTLLLTISKRFSFGWFIASFWVGDGAICLYDQKNHTAKIMGEPDEGEFGGQTRFLTMKEIFSDTTNLYKRLRFSIVQDFTALFMMTDGVSDPKFETDNNLINPDKWDELWNDLKNNEEHPVDLSDDHEEAKDELLAWLDFWSSGNHDDRTIAILY